MRKKLIFLSILALLLLPAFSFASVDLSEPIPSDNALNLRNLMISIIDSFWIIFVGIAIVMFMLAGLEFLIARGDATKIAKARAFVIWGVVGVIVALLSFSIVKIVTNLLIAPQQCPVGQTFDSSTGSCVGGI